MNEDIMDLESPESLILARERASLLAGADLELKAALIVARRSRGLTQAQIGHLMGVSQQAVNKFERYDSDPRQSTIRRYANAVGALVSHQVELEDLQPVSDGMPSKSFR